MHRYENFATKLWESVGKGHLYERVYQLDRLSEGCPLSPGARGFANPEPIGVTPLEQMDKKKILKSWKNRAKDQGKKAKSERI